MGTTAIYARISRDRDETRGGVERQRSDCQALCDAKKWPATIYEDNDISAYSGRRRPAYEQMLDGVRNGTITRIVAWHPDRLHRSLREIEDFIDIIEGAGCAVVTVTSGDYDLSTVEGRMTARIIGSVARAESEHKSRRLRRKHLEIAETGSFRGGGKRGYGHRVITDPAGRITGIEVEPDEADIVREIMSRYLAGEGISSIGHDLNKRGVATVGGGAWTGTTLRSMLRSARLSGQREHHGRILGPGEWPAIVTPEETIRARSMLTAAARRTNTGVARTYVLTGLVHCARCEARMVSGRTKGGKRRYTCSAGVGRTSCGRMATVAEPLEDLVVEQVMQVVDSTKFAATYRRRTATTGREDTAVDVLRAADAQLAELADAYADNMISMSDWVQARRRIEERADEARERIAAVHDTALLPYLTKPGTLRAAWPDLSIGQQHAVIAAVIERVLIGAATTIGRVPFDEGRVRIIWRA